jgi:4-hydroxy-4-methyl-2-oxoglutarate aldolase
MGAQSRAPEHVVEAFKGLRTALISDALDSMGIPGQALGIRPLHLNFRIAGRAFTVKYRPVSAVEPGTVGDYIDDVEPGSVVVLDNSGRMDCTVWGDILTAVSLRRGLAGTVINGVCRDVLRAIEQDYAVFSRGNTMRTGKGRVELDSIGVPVSLGEIQVRSGDIVVGDADGVVVVPRVKEQDVLDAARRIDEAEHAIEREAALGTPLADARRNHQYFRLQSR